MADTHTWHIPSIFWREQIASSSSTYDPWRISQRLKLITLTQIRIILIQVISSLRYLWFSRVTLGHSEGEGKTLRNVTNCQSALYPT
jgi:hypothetical protein